MCTFNLIMQVNLFFNKIILFFLLTISLVITGSIYQFTVSNTYLSFGQLNTSEEDSIHVNQTILALIPLMIKEIENTNATDIPIKQVINATPSNITALQHIVKNKTDNDINNSSSNLPPKDLIPMVVNLTQNTNATGYVITKMINTTNSSLKSNLGKN